MRRFATPCNHLPSMNSANTQDLGGCPVEMCFKVTKEGGDVPVMAYNDAKALMLSLRSSCREEDAVIDVVIPLTLDGGYKQCTGADTIMKYFTSRYGRLSKVVTPKNETYYGGNGLVLDKNFSPLFYVTKTFHPVNSLEEVVTIHVAPTVFTDDVSVLNKALLKKGVAYYLSNSISYWGEQLSNKIVIDNGAAIFKKPNRPLPNVDINREVRSLLRHNIDEVLGQIKYDSRFV